MNRMEAPSEAGRSMVVLVVEDEEVVRGFIKHSLEENGYVVLTARNSVEALHLGASYYGPIDVLLMDVAMKIFQNGMELASCFSLMRPETNVILTSGSGLPEEFSDFVQTWSFLPKPFSQWQLLKIVGLNSHWESTVECVRDIL